jgi:glyoxylase-like metal-dependent hydrolase (beta-lactamase superfamily II)
MLTHYHGDHSLVLGEFKDSCLIGSYLVTQKILDRKKMEWSQAGLEKWKQEKPEEAWRLDEVEVLAPTVSFQNTLIIRDDDLMVELHHAGGHTDCSSYAYAPHEKVIFAGDLMFAKCFPYAGDPTCDPDRWIEIFQEFLALDFEKLVPGHGPIVGRDEVEKHLRFFEALKQATKEAITAGKDHEAIEVPKFYELDEEKAWIKTNTLKHLYTFYKN